ncbi:carboxylesterase family protein [Sphingomonas sp.]|uniref:carboxylesterase/lipase family protein n=1 Tax=Sphingomonas sp. TaxID=28214 RepID=UPI0025E5E238|nr:carboxylesterase family protein [Sphingomonas sp.]
MAPAAVKAAPIAIDGGQIEGSQIGALRVFKGIPYAAAPTGPLRWRPPQPAPAWRGVRKANSFSPACPQLGSYPPDAPTEPTSEDCLALNVWAPAMNGAGKLPVMVWIHGGSLMNGSGSVPQYAGEQLAARGVIVVTINYRLGVLGFLAHPQLNKESRYGVSGNYGLLDQIAALKWVKRNIAAFGGDPDQVTIFGQSSGSFSASILASTPLARGLFRRAIGESGAVFEPVELDPRFTPNGAAEIGVGFANKAGAKSVADLRKMPVATLLKQRFNPQFNIDGHVIPASPHDAYEAGKQNDVDLLVGTNASEGSFFFDPASVTVGNFDSVLGRTYPSLLLKAVGAKPGNTDADARRAAVATDTDIRFRWGMWAWARHALNSGKSRVFFYRFSGAPAYRPGHPYFGLGPTHGAEMPYVFGYLDKGAADWTSQDQALASTIQQYWTNFAKSGDPNGPGLPRWPRFDNRRTMVMELGQEVRAAPLTDDARLKRIDRVYAVARFVNKYLYFLIAAAAVLFILVVAMAVRFLLRLKARLPA